MKITRRIFAFSLLIAPLIFAVGGGSADKPAANRKYLVFAGTYTTRLGAARFPEATVIFDDGSSEEIRPVVEV